MKFLQVTLVLSLIFISGLSCFKLNKHKIRKHRSADKVSTFKSFALGLIRVISNGKVKEVDKCLPKEWKLGKNQEDEKETNDSMSPAVTTLDNVLNVLDKILTAACLVKGKIIDFLKSKLKLRHRRQFFEKVKSDKKPYWKFLETEIKNKNTVRDISEAFSKVIQFFRNVKSNVDSFFKSTTYLRIKKFFDCAVGAFQSVQAMVNNIKNFIKAIENLLKGWAGFIAFIVGLICNRKAVAQAVKVCISAFKDKSEKKWELIGECVGNIVVAVAGTA